MALLLVGLLGQHLSAPAITGTKVLEFHFSLSPQAGSEFLSRKFSVLSAGRVVVEARWKPAQSSSPVSLKLSLIRPDGTEVSKEGASPLIVEYQASEMEIEAFMRNRARWSVKIINNKRADENRRAVEGALRITVPANSRTLADAQFTLHGLGNAQEMKFSVPAPGRITVETRWEMESLSDSAKGPAHLTLSLKHSGQERIYANRRGASPLRIEHQVTDLEIDRGIEWNVRIQNDNDRQTRVKGQVKITYTPSM